MMSDDEKVSQVGAAMLLLEQQKRDLAHIREKIEKVRSAYRTFAVESARWHVDSDNPEKVQLTHPDQKERDLPNYLRSQPELAALVLERKVAEDALAETKAKLTSFGLTSHLGG
jgi:hypothetical protein